MDVDAVLREVRHGEQIVAHDSTRDVTICIVEPVSISRLESLAMEGFKFYRWGQRMVSFGKMGGGVTTFRGESPFESSERHRINESVRMWRILDDDGEPRALKVAPFTYIDSCGMLSRKEIELAAQRSRRQGAVTLALVIISVCHSVWLADLDLHARREAAVATLANMLRVAVVAAATSLIEIDTAPAAPVADLPPDLFPLEID